MNMHFIYIIQFSKVPRQKLTALQQVMKFPLFFKPDNSLPCSQQPTILPYPKPHDSNPCLQILLIYISVFSSDLHIGLQRNIVLFRCSHQNPLWISLLSHAPNLLHPFYPTWYEHCDDVGIQIYIMTFPITEYSPTLSFFLPPNFHTVSRHTVF